MTRREICGASARFRTCGIALVLVASLAGALLLGFALIGPTSVLRGSSAAVLWNFTASAADGSTTTPATPRSIKRRRRHRSLGSTGGSVVLGRTTDFSGYSCGDILTVTSPADADARCAYARTCNGGDGLFLPFVFCRASSAPRYTYRMCAILSPALLLWLVLLFRMLASTAEDYFAPSPEMLSTRLGLPPRFAGASLLALGNGAPDISATVNAVISDPTNGYNLALGALTGGGMFVGTVVAGSAIIAAGGVPCRGALVRDVTAYLLGIALVIVFLRRGEVGGWAVMAFFSFYALYASSVLAADVYHRKVVVPRVRGQEERRALERQAEMMEETGLLDAEGKESLAARSMTPPAEEASDATAAMTSDRSPPDLEPDRFHSTYPDSRVPESDVSSRDSIKEESDLPLADQLLSLLSNYDRLSTRSLGRPMVLHGPEGVLADRRHHHHCKLAPHRDEATLSAVAEDLAGIDHFVEQEEGDNVQELRAHWEEVWHDVFHDETANPLEKFLLALELPFTVLRKLSIPVPCEGYYCRPLVALSLALSPLWIGAYARAEYGADLFMCGDGISYVGIMCLPSFAIGASIWRYADEREMSLSAAGPIALYSFVLAATWIDFIGDQLVTLLEFLGVVLRIPSPVMGLTVLAWGNSMGDLAANVALARKGLANMAMTACFASPLFNMLIGLGSGFVSIRNEAGQIGTVVSLSPSVSTGFFFLLSNCIMVATCGLLLHKGKIPEEYGYAMFAMYICYIVASIVVQFMKIGH